jgi:hypothetical protein
VRVLRALVGRLDPWAALLFGSLIALGVIILLATPGPWHEVVGQPSRVKLTPPPPTNIAVFTTGDAGTCSAVLWLHIDHSKPSLSAVVLASNTQGFVPGAGYAPLRSVVDEAGPSAAAQALGRALGVNMDAWVELDRDALRLAVEPMYPVLEGRARLAQYRRSRAAWEGRLAAKQAWVRQYQTLQVGLPRVAYDRVNVVTFSNYVLGFGHVRSNLNLEGATGIATSLVDLLPSQVRVCAVGAVVETCRRGESWRLNGGVVEQMRLSFELSIPPARTGPGVRREARPARVLVVLPGAWQGYRAYVAQVRQRLQRSAGAPVAVRVLAVSQWAKLVPRVTAVTQSWRPLAVLVAPPEVLPTAAAPAAAALRALGESLIASGQPAVMSSRLPQTTTPLPASADGRAGILLDAAIGGSGLPVSSLAAAPVVAGASASASPLAMTVDKVSAVASPPTLRAAARANIDTLVRACWPGTLAPRLASTKLSFWFAARRRTTVGVLAPSAQARRRVMGQLGAWGYQSTVLNASAWTPLITATSVYYHTGMRRAALALAGDLGLSTGAVIADNSAPAALTLHLLR